MTGQTVPAAGSSNTARMDKRLAIARSRDGLPADRPSDRRPEPFPPGAGKHAQPRPTGDHIPNQRLIAG
jgi:hypothetical protein